MEVFDSEVARAREAIAQLPGFEVAPLVSELDRELLRYTSKVPDRGLSQLIVPPLAALYGEEPGAPSAKIQSWFTEKRDQIGELYANYEGNFEVNPLFYQPEAFLIYERADNDPTGLKSAWPEEIPRELLVSLTELWGNPVE
jgi:hypothetical protein